MYAPSRPADRPIDPPPHILLAGSGRPLLFLHGWGASSELLIPAIRGLQTFRRVVAPDFPGFGRTPPPPRGWDVEDYARWVVQILDEQEIATCPVVGHSFGGRVAIKLATQWPQRVSSLVLTGSAGLRPRTTPAAAARIRLFKLTRRAARLPVLPPRVRSALLRKVASAGSADYRAATGTVRESLVRVVNEDLRSALPAIAVPTILVWGDRDDATPLRDGQEMEALIPDAHLIVLEGAGHYAYLEQADRFSRIVRAFLEGIER